MWGGVKLQDAGAHAAWTPVAIGSIDKPVHSDPKKIEMSIYTWFPIQTITTIWLANQIVGSCVSIFFFGRYSTCYTSILRGTRIQNPVYNWERLIPFATLDRNLPEITYLKKHGYFNMSLIVLDRCFKPRDLCVPYQIIPYNSVPALLLGILAGYSLHSNPQGFCPWLVLRKIISFSPMDHKRQPKEIERWCVPIYS